MIASMFGIANSSKPALRNCSNNDIDDVDEFVRNSTFTFVCCCNFCIASTAPGMACSPISIVPEISISTALIGDVCAFDVVDYRYDFSLWVYITNSL